jgi:D-alanine-D-alanine ligase
MALKLKSQRPPAVPPKHSFKAAILYSIMSDWSQDDATLSEECITRMKRSLGVMGIEATAVPIRTDVAGPLQGLDPREHVVFNWAEGLDGAPNAYDAVPPVLEGMGFAYTGSDAWALAATLDKSFTKRILLENRIPTPVSKVYERAVLNGWRRYPALVKPSTEHCSFGISRDAVVDNPQQLKERIQYVVDTWKCPALVEDFIDGPEYNVAIWGGEAGLEVLPISTIDFSAFADYHDRLVSFDAKWNPDSEAYRLMTVQCPAILDKVLRRRIERVALAAYQALRLRDYGRVDMRVRNGVPYVLDVNANPDVTMEGGFARSARAAGYDYGQMTARLLSLAARRMPNGRA